MNLNTFRKQVSIKTITQPKIPKSATIQPRQQNYSSASKVLFKKHSTLCTEFQLNNPLQLNAIDNEMVKMMQGKLNQWAAKKEQEPKAVFLTGAGDVAFSAGGELGSLYINWRQNGNTNMAKKVFADQFRQNYAIATMNPIQIALWDGYVIGNGFDLSCFSPIRIATEKSIFTLPQSGNAQFIFNGASKLLSNLNGNPSLGLYLCLTGHQLRSDELVQWGIATDYVPSDRLSQLQEEIANNINDKTQLEDIQQIIESYSDNSIQNQPIQDIQKINELFKPEGSFIDLINRLENDHSVLAQNALQKMKEMSPLSLRLIFELIKRTQDMSLKQTFEQEYSLCQGMIDDSDFYKGISTILQSKDKYFKWKHDQIEDVACEEVEKYFQIKQTFSTDMTQSINGIDMLQ